MTGGKCKRCAAKTALTAEQINKMVAQVTSMRGIRLADRAEYERRMAVCRGCESFFEGATCLMCGCVMQVRARLADSRCPAPGGGKWKK